LTLLDAVSSAGSDADVVIEATHGCYCATSNVNG
jgi:hypothetical protein